MLGQLLFEILGSEGTSLVIVTHELDMSYVGQTHTVVVPLGPLDDIGAAPSIGSVGDPIDNAIAADMAFDPEGRFLAFVPTDFVAISDLGMTAFGGILAVLFLTLTLMPVLLGIVMTPKACRALAARGRAAGMPIPRATHPRVVIATALGLDRLRSPS